MTVYPVRVQIKKTKPEYNVCETDPNRLSFEFGTVTATVTKRFKFPKGAKILNVYAETNVTQATHASNLIKVGAVNKGTAGSGTGTIVDYTDAANSNNSTGGSAFTAYTARAMTVITTSNVNILASGEILEVTITIGGTISKDINVYIDYVDHIA